MSFDNFVEKIVFDLQSYFGDSVKVISKKVRKNNGLVLTGISVTSESSNISPTIYLEHIYAKYEKGVVYAQIVKEIIDIFEKNDQKRNFDMEFFTKFENIKSRIVYKLINLNKNADLLEEIPYIKYLDMAIVFYYLLSNEFTENELAEKMCNASILIYNTHLQMWDVTTDDLYEAAKENSPVLLPAKCVHICDILKETFMRKLENEESEDECEKNISDDKKQEMVDDMFNTMFRDSSQMQMYVITNNVNYFGAAAILYKDVLKKFAEKHNCDFYILPSSVHEVIAVGRDTCPGEKELCNMVSEVNRTQLEYDEILSDSVYYYDYRENKLSLCESPVEV